MSFLEKINKAVVDCQEQLSQWERQLEHMVLIAPALSQLGCERLAPYQRDLSSCIVKKIASLQNQIVYNDSDVKLLATKITILASLKDEVSQALYAETQGRVGELSFHAMKALEDRITRHLAHVELGWTDRAELAKQVSMNVVAQAFRQSGKEIDESVACRQDIAPELVKGEILQEVWDNLTDLNMIALSSPRLPMDAKMEAVVRKVKETLDQHVLRQSQERSDKVLESIFDHELRKLMASKTAIPPAKDESD